MQLVVKPSSVHGSIQAAPSKSYTHRAIAMAGLAHGDSSIIRPLLSADTKATLEGMRKFGSIISTYDSVLEIRGGLLKCPDSQIDCANSGTTIRLLSGIASLLPCTVTLTGDESLRQRPMKPLMAALKELGVQAISVNGDGNPPITIRGPNKGRWAHIKGDISSQFISSLLISSPLKELDTEIIITSPLVSKPYIDITIEMMSKFGVKIDATKNGYHVLGGQRYEPNDFHVPGDYSSVSFALAAAALTGKVSVKGLDQNDKQGDRAIIEFLKHFGAEVDWKNGFLEVANGPLMGIEADLSDSPDLFPILAVLGTQAQGETRLFNASHLRIKETDRIKTTASFLRSMGAAIQETGDGCVIKGPTRLHGAQLNSYGDHRILMAGAVAALVADSPTTISQGECYEISYPNFIKDMRSLGATLELIP